MEFLSEAKLVELTKRVRYSAQERALRAMGIECKRRPDGSVAVLAAAVEQAFGVQPAGTAKMKRQPKIDWGTNGPQEKIREPRAA